MTFPVPQANLAESSFPEELKIARDMWPFVPPSLSASSSTLQDLVEAQLPGYEHALSLVDAFLRNYSWSFRPTDREQLVEEIFPHAFKRRSNIGSSVGPEESKGRVDPHDLALLFIVFACGARRDTVVPHSKNGEAALYFELACACLGLKSVLHNTSLSTVQALSLMAIFELTMKNDLEASWRTMSLALASAVGVSAFLMMNN